MSFSKCILTAIGLLLVCCSLSSGDIMVQLHVNRPFNDVNEKFVSFSIKPEDLYKALDGPRRKSMTRMASMMGDSYIKFVGDYHFVSHVGSKLRNPTKIIWKGFNRWSRAINWTMIIPVPYSPNTWDPMQTLKILNTSYSIDITDCIWQLGTDFGSSRAENYVADLNTLLLMTESFRPQVNNWRIMGADISAGSSAEETARYIEMSKDLNAAFGFTGPIETKSTNLVSGSIYERDAALKMLLSKKVPVWLNLPQNVQQKSKPNNSRVGVEEINSAFRWAQTLGEAASAGFDAIFKRISLSDLERPTASFYITVLFKKVMGSRVFPSRPLNMFAKGNKLYTHCANDISGGIAFMVINTDDRPLQISLKSLSKFAGAELWQYTLTFKKNSVVLLNNERLTLNSSLSPQKRVMTPDSPIQLKTPAKAVSFWVLPTANIEHCQFTEIEAEDWAVDSAEKVLDKRHTSTDRLLKKLIQEISLSQDSFSRISSRSRSRRYATFAERQKRFILESGQDLTNGLKLLFDPADPTTPARSKSKVLEKREEPTILPAGEAAWNWLQQFMPSAMKSDLPLLKRDTRSAGNSFHPFFSNKESKKTGFIKKITEIRKPEKMKKPIFDHEEFDEEQFFKKIGDNYEQEYSRLPEGDVHLKHITNADGDEIEDIKIERGRSSSVGEKDSGETHSEMKPLRLLPTEFYEALPVRTFMQSPKHIGLSEALNSLLFPEQFSKKLNKSTKSSRKQQQQEQQQDSISEVDEIGTRKYQDNTQLGKDFKKSQMELSRSYLGGDASKNADEYINDGEESTAEPIIQKDVISNYFSNNYFGDMDIIGDTQELRDHETLTEDYTEIPWWDVSMLRKKRSTAAGKIPTETWRSNLITKDDALTPLGLDDPNEMSIYGYEVKPSTKTVTTVKETLTNSLLKKVKHKVSRLMSIVSRHVSEWYDTLTKRQS